VGKQKKGKSPPLLVIMLNIHGLSFTKKKVGVKWIKKIQSDYKPFNRDLVM
jgi:hypothetical protein